MSNLTLRSPSVRVALVALVTLVASVVGSAPAAATADEPRVVRLVQHADGSLEVVTGLRFSWAGGDVLVKEEDVTLSTTSLLGDVIDTATGLVDDALRRDQWNLDLVSAEAVWERGTGRGAVIAVIDSGVDGAHPDLVDRLVPGYSATGSDELVDGLGHGTHVAGTAAASVGGGYGVTGLAPMASVMPVKVTDDEGMAYASDVAEGLIWAADNGATVANLSLAGTRESQVLSTAIDYAVGKGVVVVAAGGNEFARGNPRTYPASHPQVIAVAAMRDAATRSSFSSTGDWIDIAAPGSSILSTRPGATFGYASGTSMAAPLVAGAVAVLQSTSTGLDVAGVRSLLLDTATDIGRTGWDEEFGHGHLDLLTAIEQITPTPAFDEAPADEPEAPADEVEADVDEVAAPTAPGLSRIPGLYTAGTR